mgnify:CR=1 FL=1|tara:strand:- start:634 stop:3009 length:2376 start_codon:yes stop_codon:yes gene_type:complete
MAYGELYRVNFFDTDEHKFLLQIFEDNYSGIVSTNIKLGPDPVVISYQQDNDYFSPLIGSSCKLQFYVEDGTGGEEWELEESKWNLADFLWNAEGNISFLEPQNDRQFKVKVNSLAVNGTSDAYAPAYRLKDTSVNFTNTVNVGDLVLNTTTNATALVSQVSTSDTLKISEDIFSSAGNETFEIYRIYWTGFIMQDSFNLPLQPYPFLIEAYASDLLGTLEGYDYELTTTRPSTFDAIRECMRQINLENGQGDVGKSLDFSYNFLCRIFQSANNVSSPKGNPYAQSHINDVQAFKDQNGNKLDCKNILNSLLLMYNCRIFQYYGTWTIISNDAMSLSAFDENYASSNPSQFISYDKNGSNESTFSLTNSQVVFNVNSSKSSDTIQPLGGDLFKTIRRPAIRNRVNIRIKDSLKDTLVNGNFESVSAPSGSIPSDAYAINTWTITNTANTFAVDEETATYGIIPYQGTYSMINIGNDTTGGGDTNIIASNNSIALTNTSDSLSFQFSVFADEPSTYDGNLLDYFFYFKIYITPATGSTYYWSIIDNQWKTSTVTINNIRGDVSNEWVRYNYTLTPPPITGTVTVELYEPEEANFSQSNFRFYLDEMKFASSTQLEYYSTLTTISQTTFKKNSGVIPPVDVRFGQIQDIGYTNTLTNSSGNAITSFQHFDYNFNTNLEALMCRLRLADLSVNNGRYEGTFKKISNSSNYLTPIDMLSFLKLNFNTLTSNTDQLAIDNFEWNVSKNRYKLRTHTPNQQNLTSFSDVTFTRGYFNTRPEDSSDPFMQYAYVRNPN